MDTAFCLEIAEGIIAFELDRGGFYAGVLAFELVRDGDLVAVPLAPAHVHSHEHSRPVVGLGAACPRVDCKHCSEIVSFLAEHVAKLQGLKFFKSLGIGFVQFPDLLCLDVFCRAFKAILCKVIEHVQVFCRRGNLVISIHPEFHCGKFLQKCLCLLRVIPEIRRKCFFLFLSDIIPFLLHIDAFPEDLNPLLQFSYLLYCNHIEKSIIPSEQSRPSVQSCKNKQFSLTLPSFS